MALPAEIGMIPVNDLAQVYREGTISLTHRIHELRAAGLSDHHAKAALHSALRELKGLQDYTDDWIVKNIPASYRAGWDTAYNSTLYATPSHVGGATRYGSFGMVHRRAIEQVAYSMQNSIGAALQQVGRQINDIYRQEGLQATVTRLFTGETIKQTQKSLAQKLLLETGKPYFTDAAGRNWSLDNYAKMVARTTTREATTQGTLQRARAGGHKLVQLSEHDPTCELCAPLQGLVYTLDQNDKRYPLWDDSYCPVHPNCLHVTYIYIDKYDRNREATMKRSAAFDPTKDPRSAAQKQAYNALQKQNASVNALRNQYARYVARLGKEAGTIQSFARAKYAGGKRWSELQAAYRGMTAGAKLGGSQTTVPYAMLNDAGAQQFISTRIANDIKHAAAKLQMTEKQFIKEFEAMLKQVNAKAQLSVQTPEGVLSQILKDGRWKTQFETGSSGGSLSPANRQLAEKYLFGAPHNLPPAQRPVYGFLKDASIDPRATQQYGNVRAVLKDTVRARTTVTYTDSLSPGLNEFGMASMVNNPTINSVTGTNIFMSNKTVLTPSSSTLAAVTERYPEIQIHGGLSVKDVDHFVFKSEPSSALAAQLLLAGIKWVVGM